MPKTAKKSSSRAVVQNILHPPILHFPAAWAALAGIVLLDAVWLSHTWLAMPSPWRCFTLPLLLVNAKLLYHLLFMAELPVLHCVFLLLKKTPWEQRLSLGVEYVALCYGTGLALCLLSYLVCTLPYPLADRFLDRLDHLMGFDWSRWFHWSLHSSFYTCLKIAYASMVPQFLLFVACFSFWQRKNRLVETFWILLVGLSLTVILSGFVPALGPASLFGLESAFGAIQPLFKDSLAQVTAIRAGINPDFEAHKLSGIITFPSFHTVCAIAFAYSWRQTGLLGLVALGLNLMMLLSIPFFGDHYFIDMVAGAIIALLSIGAVKMVARKAGLGEKTIRRGRPRPSLS